MLAVVPGPHSNQLQACGMVSAHVTDVVAKQLVGIVRDETDQDAFYHARLVVAKLASVPESSIAEYELAVAYEDGACHFSPALYGVRTTHCLETPFSFFSLCPPLPPGSSRS